MGANDNELQFPARYGQNEWEIVLGKKNWLFAGSERAGRRAAAIQSLLATAKLNGIEPLAWLTNTLSQLPTCPNSQIDSLLPLAKNNCD
jgi:transposase